MANESIQSVIQAAPDLLTLLGKGEAWSGGRRTALERRIHRIDQEMERALCAGAYGRAAQLARVQAVLLARIMG